MNKYYNTLLLMLILNSSIAQTNKHYNIWSRFSMIKELNTKFKIEVESQKRWQNNVVSNQNKNPFSKKLMYSVRFWTHYKLNSKFNFSISPFAYFQHYAIINTESDVLKKKSYEIRYTLASDFKEKILNKTYFYNRLAFEFRDFKNNNNENVIRLRNKTGFKYDFNEKWSLFAFDELFLNLNSKDKKHFFDHNRIGISASFIPIKEVKIDFGYIYIDRLSKNSNEITSDNNFLIMAYYTFKK